MQHQPAKLEWRDGQVPVSKDFDDPYFSLDNGLGETQHVFLSGNDLPARFGGDFSIAELGFGTGLNFLATWAAWEAAGAPGNLSFTSFEAFPMAIEDQRRALAAFPQLSHLSARMLSGDLGQNLERPNLRLKVIVGDARATLPAWGGQADAWFLDGFSPVKNPELWEHDLMSAVAQHTVSGGSFATYTAAGFVRRALSDAGFEVQRQPGFGRKRHMTTGRLP